MSLTYVITSAGWLIGCAIGVGLGRRAARITALLLTAQFLVVASEPLLLNNPNAIRPAAILSDCILAFVFAAMAVRKRRQWTFAAAAFQILAALTHLARILSPQVKGWAYMTGTIIWSYAALAAVVWGAERERAERE